MSHLNRTVAARIHHKARLCLFAVCGLAQADKELRSPALPAESAMALNESQIAKKPHSGYGGWVASLLPCRRGKSPRIKAGGTGDFPPRLSCICHLEYQRRIFEIMPMDMGWNT